MKYVLIVDGVVDTVSYEPVEGWEEAPDDVFAGFSVAGEIGERVFTPPAPDLAQIRLHFQREVQRHVDEVAQAKNYNDAVTCAGYANSTVPAWEADARTFTAWRDQVWVYLFSRMMQVEVGEAPIPESTEALIAELPQIEWPG